MKIYNFYKMEGEIHVKLHSITSSIFGTTIQIAKIFLYTCSLDVKYFRTLIPLIQKRGIFLWALKLEPYLGGGLYVIIYHEQNRDYAILHHNADEIMSIINGNRN